MYKRIYDSDEITVDYYNDGKPMIRISVFEDGHWVGEHFLDAVPVVHAHWYDDYGGRYANQRWRCSACRGGALWEFEQDELGHEKAMQAMSVRCPHCGAHMDEED